MAALSTFSQYTVVWGTRVGINVHKAKPKEHAQAYTLPATHLKGPKESNG